MTHVHLRNWRNFVRADVELGQRAFLVGPNASGKSNLLDVFRFLHDIVSAGGLQEAVRKRGGVRRLRCLAARQYSDLGILVHIGNDRNPAEWEYELQLNQDGRARPVIKSERLSRPGRELFARPDGQDTAEPERLLQSCLEQAALKRELKEVAGFLGSVRYLHVMPALVREPERSAGRREDPFGGDFLEDVAATPEKTRKARLRRVLEALGTAAPHLQQLEVRRDARGAPHLRGRYGHWRARGAWFTENEFSDGTLRAVALLWAAQDGAGPLLLEEPEISLHPELARLVPGMLARVQRLTGRQMILTTHCRELFHAGGIEPVQVLLLTPGDEGTSIRPALDLKEVETLLEGGGLLEKAAPPSGGEVPRQFALFDE